MQCYKQMFSPKPPLVQVNNRAKKTHNQRQRALQQARGGTSRRETRSSRARTLLGALARGASARAGGSPGRVSVDGSGGDIGSHRGGHGGAIVVAGRVTGDGRGIRLGG